MSVPIQPLPATSGVGDDDGTRFVWRRAWLVLLLIIVMTRTGLNVVWFTDAWTRPDDCHFLESSIARLIDIAARPDERLYPDPAAFPHLNNVFAPGYFDLVARWRRSMTGDETLTVFLGRTVTLIANLLLAVTLLVIVAWRLGFGAGLFAAATWGASLTLIGFGVMVRPDLLATLLGLAGFLLASSRRGTLNAIGVITIITAALVKQTSLLFLGAAALAHWRGGRRAQAIGLIIGGLGGLALAVHRVDRSVHPGVAAAFLFESGTPFHPKQFLEIFIRALVRTPELFLLIAWSWWSLRPSKPGWPAPAEASATPEVRAERESVREFAGIAQAGATIAALAAILTIGKIGSDMNYLLPLAATAPLVAGLLAASIGRDPVARSAVRPAGWPTLIALAVAWLMGAAQQWNAVQAVREVVSDERHKEMRTQFNGLQSRMRDVRGFVLTDHPRLAMTLGARSAIRDPWLYRQLVEDGRLSADPVLQRIRKAEFEYVIVGHPPGVDAPFALPTRVSKVIPDHYQFAFAAGGLQVWARKGARLAP